MSESSKDSCPYKKNGFEAGYACPDTGKYGDMCDDCSYRTRRWAKAQRIEFRVQFDLSDGKKFRF